MASNDKKIIQFKNDIEMYEYLNDALASGYKIINTIGLSLEICKDNEVILLTFFENVNNLELKEFKTVKPDYNDTLLSVVSGIRNNFGSSYSYPLMNDVIDKKYERVVVLILDGLASHIVKMLPDTSFLKKNYFKDIHALYPSTTAAATTSIKSGLSPLESGWTGWENYLREIKKNVVLFTGVDYFSDEPTGVSAYSVIPYKTFFHDMNVKGAIIEPDFSKLSRDLSDVLKRSLKGLKANDEVQYVYFTEPDSSLHHEGLTDNIINMIVEMDKKIEDYASKLPKNTLLLISADHGHVNVKPLDFYGYTLFNKMLNRKPCNDARCITFSVKDEYKESFELLFDQCFKNVYKLMKSSDAINEGYFGFGTKNSRIDDFLGDYVAVAINEYYFNYKCDGDILFKSHHAGITEQEMIIPVCKYEAI